MKFASKKEFRDEIFRRIDDGRLPCYGPTGNGYSCKYRHNGNACIAGMTIADEDYSKGLEGKIYYIGNDVANVCQLPPGVTPQQMQLLQNEHDACIDICTGEIIKELFNKLKEKVNQTLKL